MAQTRNLSDILGDIQVRSAQWTRIELGRNAGFQVPRGRQVAVHLVVSGNPVLAMKSRAASPLRPGDAMIVLDRLPHVIRSGEASRIAPFDPPASNWLFGDTSRLCFGDTADNDADTRAVVLTGLLRVRWPGELSQWRLLPPVLHGNRNFKSAAAGLEATAVFDELTSRPGGSQCITRYVDFLLVRELQQVLERSPGLLRVQARADLQMEQALAAIAQDPAEAWSVASLADHVGMSRSTFAERFLRYVGVTPMALVFQHRMELAAQYLKQAVLPVKEIAALIGYGSVATFTRAFSAHFGTSPAAWRKAALAMPGG
ncbi:MAG: helix-turn-helix transcriptional regulator [Novosphingobium sp.]|nr:helix-turn-helix transcriptional regulator [Novosphingobium sp.]